MGASTRATPEVTQAVEDGGDQQFPPEPEFPGNDRLSLGHETRIGNVTNEKGPGVAVVVAASSADKNMGQDGHGQSCVCQGYRPR